MTKTLKPLVIGASERNSGTGCSVDLQRHDISHCGALIMLQLQNVEVILLYPSSQVCHQNKGTLEGGTCNCCHR